MWFLIKFLIGRNFIVFLFNGKSAAFCSNDHGRTTKFILIQNECLRSGYLCLYYCKSTSLSKVLTKKINTKNLLCNSINTYTDSAELPLSWQLLVSIVSIVPWWSLMSAASIVPLWSLVSTANLVPWWSLLSNADPLILSHDGHLSLHKPCALCRGQCCPMQTPYLVPCWSFVSTANLYLVTRQPPVYVLQCLHTLCLVGITERQNWRY